MPTKPSTASPRRRKGLMIAAAGAIVLYAVVGFLILPPILRSQASEKLSEALDRPVVIEKVALNPFALSITVRGLTVADHDGAELAGFDEFYANLQASSLFRWTWYLREVRLERPRGRIVVNTNGTLNVADLVPETTSEPAAGGKPTAPPRFLIETLSITNGSVHFRDLSHPDAFENTAGPVTATLRHFGTGGSEAGGISLRGNTESGEKFSFEGLADLNTLDFSGRWTVTGVHAPKYDPFHNQMTLFEIAEGKISYDFRFAASLKDGLSWRIDPSDVVVENLHIRARGENAGAIYIPTLYVSGIHADSISQSAGVARIALAPFVERNIPEWSMQGSGTPPPAGAVPTIRMTRLSDGSIDLAALLTPRIPPDSSGDTPSPSGPAFAWSAKIGEFVVQDLRVELTDQSNARPARVIIDRINTTVRDVSTDAAAAVPFEASLRWQESGTFTAGGNLRREPLLAEVTLDASGLSLAGLDPYLAAFADVRVTDGVARVSGKATLSQETGAPDPSLMFEGEAGLDRLAIQAPDEKPLTSLDSLAFRGIRFSSPPVKVDIAEIGVSGPAVDVVVGEDGSNNLAAVLVQDAPVPVDSDSPEAQPVASDAPRPVITIGRVVIDGGRATVTDRSFKPEFSTSLREIGGIISGLSSEQVARGDVDLKGTLDGTAPFHVSGKVNPLSEDAFTDLKVDFTGIGLPAFTPYSGKFVGYKIDRGRLTLDLTYRLSQRVLEAENKVTLDQFYLGETVESPDAMNLPLKLALGLLRDRNGKIDIDLPIRGNLDDPDFKYGSVVWKAVGNLIMKAATAPFSLLGKLIPGGGDPEALSFVEFAPGSATIDESSANKLLTLASVLYDRPALKLEIVSAPAPLVDAAPLRAAKFEANLLALRQGQTATPADAAPAPLGAAEREDLIRKAYAATFPGEVPTTTPEAPPEADGKKPGIFVRTVRRIFGTAEQAPSQTQPGSEASADTTVEPGPSIAEMESRLLAAIEIAPSEFEALAAERATAVREKLVATEKVEPDRLSTTSPAAADAAEARVTFSLK